MVRRHRPGGPWAEGETVKRLRWLIVAAAMVLVVAMTAGPAVGADSTTAKLTATDVGITPTEIRIGVIADTGSQLAPGLFQGAVDGVQAWADYMNAKEGGLAGRKIVVDTYDSKLSADDARNAIIEACSKDFATVGTSALFVNNVDDLVGCKDSKGVATGMPDFPVVTTEVVAAVLAGLVRASTRRSSIARRRTSTRRPTAAAWARRTTTSRSSGRTRCTACSCIRPT